MKDNVYLKKMFKNHLAKDFICDELYDTPMKESAGREKQNTKKRNST